ncbi:hypothetical protein G6F65_022320 [Rhizopus arrhizus]|nr:hypothetical protein G6F65_022320 [Rhizopus arrhizus]
MRASSARSFASVRASAGSGSCASSTRPIDVQYAGKRLPSPIDVASRRFTSERARYSISWPSMMASAQVSLTVALSSSNTGWASDTNGVDEKYA